MQVPLLSETRRLITVALALSGFVAQAMFSVACARPFQSVPSPHERRERAEEAARAGGFERLQFEAGLGSSNSAPAGFLPVAAWRRPSPTPRDGPIRIYIEGDGYAWQSRRHPSADPTPIRPVALELALADPSQGEIVYLARPCQYSASLPPACSSRLWTHARFGEEVLSALSKQIDVILEQDRANARTVNLNRAHTKPHRLVLIGYSGGGVMAALLAATRDDVERLITVAAPLDIHRWTAQNRMTPLFDSLSPMAFLEALAPIPQLHFAGGRDPSVGTEIIESYAGSARDLTDHKTEEHEVRDPGQVQVRFIADANHSDWPSRWRALTSEAFSD